MAQAYPNSTFVGSDYHQGSIALARERSAAAGVADRATFEVASATEVGGGPYDLVTAFDCLHDMGEPVAAAVHVRDQLADHGTWLVVEPRAGDTVSENLNPVGRVYYSFSTFLCVPNALSQGGRHTLGAQAGQQAIRDVVTEAGFTASGGPQRRRSTSSTRSVPNPQPDRRTAEFQDEGVYRRIRRAGSNDVRRCAASDDESFRRPRRSRSYLDAGARQVSRDVWA